MTQRILAWVIAFAFLFGVSQTAYAMDKEPVIWVQVPQWTDDWAVCAAVSYTHLTLPTNREV